MSQLHEENQNRFRDLPTEVICKILGNLDIQDIARVRKLSREFGKFCTLVPRLNITRPKMEEDENRNKNKLDNFFEFLNRYSDKLFEERSLLCIKLHWTRNDFEVFNDEEDHLVKWLSRATRDTNVKKIDFRIDNSLQFSGPVVPHCLFQHCPSLERLRLNVYKGIINLPPSSFAFDSLRHLSLEDVDVASDEYFGKLLSQSCKNLKKLILKNILGVKNLSISCHSLHTLQIITQARRSVVESINVEAKSLKKLFLRLGCHHNSLRIFAPNLDNLVLRAMFVAKNYDLENFKCLQSASVYLFQINDQCTSTKRSIHKLLQWVSVTRNLYVNQNILEVLGDSKLQFSAVQDLKIKNFGNPEVGSCLTRFPNIKLLSVSVESCPAFPITDASSYWENYWEKHWECWEFDFVHRIKSVQVDLFYDKDRITVQGFVKYLLKIAQALEKITIRYSVREFPRPQDLAAEFGDEYSTRIVLQPVGIQCRRRMVFEIQS